MLRSGAFAVMGAALVATLLGCGGAQNQPPEDESGSEDEAGESSGDPTEADECAGAEGCFDCPPTEPAHLLNACTDATCAPFLNTAERLPLLKADGGLPPLP